MEVPARGNLVPDAHIAAILKLHGIRTLYSRDRDFARFAFLRVIDPLKRE
jgi:predicted nucleic acid-binding protein